MNLDWFYPLRWTAVKLLRLVTLLAQAPEEIATPTLQLTHSSSQPLPLDVYLPSTQSTDPLPIHINLHGSGFCHNTFGLDAPFCRFLADSTPRIVVDADYRKAPEHSWPTPVEDVRSADARVRELAAERGWDGRRISLGGFSSGGTLALIEAARAGKAGEEIAAVVVFCPSCVRAAFSFPCKLTRGRTQDEPLRVALRQTPALPQPRRSRHLVPALPPPPPLLLLRPRRDRSHEPARLPLLRCRRVFPAQRHYHHLREGLAREGGKGAWRED